MATTFRLKRKLFGVGQVLGNAATFGGLKNFQAISKTASVGQNAKNLALGVGKSAAAVGTAAVGTTLALGHDAMKD